MKRFLFVLLFLAVGAGLIGVFLRDPQFPRRRVELTITGPAGQHFSGQYAANGLTNCLDAVAPAKITVLARALTYEFQPADDREEFRVVLAVETSPRTSFVSYKGQSVRGGWRSSADGESAW